MFVFKKRNLIIISTLLITAITFIICLGALSVRAVNEETPSKIRVVIDAGHGGVDGGVSGVTTGVKESDLNLKVAFKLEEYFLSAGISVVLTRNSEAGLYGNAVKNLKRKDMEKRRDIIKSVKPDLVISVHMNKYSLQSRRGAQVFYKKGSENGKLLAENVQKSFNLMSEAVRSCSALTGDYYILNCTEYPSVIVECGFLSNPEDEALLITDKYQQSVAYAIFKGVIEYFAHASFNYFN